MVPEASTQKRARSASPPADTNEPSATNEPTAPASEPPLQNAADPLDHDAPWHPEYDDEMHHDLEDTPHLEDAPALQPPCFELSGTAAAGSGHPHLHDDVQITSLTHTRRVQARLELVPGAEGNRPMLGGVAVPAPSAPLPYVEEAAPRYGGAGPSSQAATSHQQELLATLYPEGLPAGAANAPFHPRVRRPTVADYASPDDGGVRMELCLGGNNSESSVEVYEEEEHQQQAEQEEVQQGTTDTPTDPAMPASSSRTRPTRPADNVAPDDGHIDDNLAAQLRCRLQIEGMYGREEGDQERPEEPVPAPGLDALTRVLQQTRIAGEEVDQDEEAPAEAPIANAAAAAAAPQVEDVTLERYCAPAWESGQVKCRLATLQVLHTTSL